MHQESQIPRPALVLGWLGVIPFAALALLELTAHGEPHGAAIKAIILYASIILSFMGGAQWGLGMLRSGENTHALGSQLAISVLPALAAFGLSFIRPVASLLGLTATFALLLLYDIRSAEGGLAPRWYAALRMQLTGAVALCLLLAAFVAEN